MFKQHSIMVKTTKLLLLIGVLLALPSLVSAQDNYFLDIPGIPGESQDVQYFQQICISTFSWNVEVDFTGGSGGGGASKAQQDDVLLGKVFDISSTELFEATLKSTVFKEMILTATALNSSGQSMPVTSYRFRDAFIVRYQPGGTEEGQVKEVIGIRADRVEITDYDENGNVVSVFGWNFNTNLPD